MGGWPITISGGTNSQYAINGGNFTSAAGTILPNQSFVVETTSSGSYDTPATATVSIGTAPNNLELNFQVTTLSE